MNVKLLILALGRNIVIAALTNKVSIYYLEKGLKFWVQSIDVLHTVICFHFDKGGYNTL